MIAILLFCFLFAFFTFQNEKKLKRQKNTTITTTIKKQREKKIMVKLMIGAVHFGEKHSFNWFKLRNTNHFNHFEVQCVMYAWIIACLFDDGRLTNKVWSHRCNQANDNKTKSQSFFTGHAILCKRTDNQRTKRIMKMKMRKKRVVRQVHMHLIPCNRESHSVQ